MKRVSLLLGMACLCALLVARPASVARAQDHHGHDHHGHDHHGHDHGDHGAAEMEAQMAEYMKYANPGEHHDHMKHLIGSWNAVVKVWAAPGAEPMESHGTCTNRWILGDRFVHTDFESSFMGNPFQGAGVFGYDQIQKKHISVWMDTMGTGMMVSEGDCSADGKVVTERGEYPDIMTGTMKKTKAVTRIVNDDKHVMTMYEVGPGNSEIRTMEITYTRM